MNHYEWNAYYRVLWIESMMAIRDAIGIRKVTRTKIANVLKQYKPFTVRNYW